MPRRKRLAFSLCLNCGGSVLREYKGSGKILPPPVEGETVRFGAQEFTVSKIVWTFGQEDDNSLIKADVILE